MTKRYKVLLTKGAERDLDDIAGFLAREASTTVARAFLDAMLERIAELEMLPDRGAVPRELEALGITIFRQLSAKPYRLFYNTEGESVIIMLIVDGRRDMGAVLERRLLQSGG